MKKHLLLCSLVFVTLLLAGCDLPWKGFSPDRDGGQKAGDEMREESSENQSSQSFAGLSWPYCLDAKFIDIIRNNKAIALPSELIGEAVGTETIKRFFNNPKIQSYEASGEVEQLCVLSPTIISFVIYGKFEGGNNVIGIFNEKLVTIVQDNADFGDVGQCVINGSIEGSVIYSCGGGDGPSGRNKVFVLNGENGQSTLVKDCATNFAEGSVDAPVVNCTVNLLQLPANFYH